MSRRSTADELALGEGALYSTWRFLVRYVAPIALVLILMSNILGSFE